MHSAFTAHSAKTNTTPIISILTDHFQSWLSRQEKPLKQWLKAINYTAESGAVCLVPDTEGSVQCVLLGLKNHDDFWAFGALPAVLPKGIYHLEKSDALKTVDQIERAHLGFALGHYQFSTYKQNTPREAQLQLPKTLKEKSLQIFVEAITLVRDLINTPAEDMGPDDIEKAVKNVAKTYDATVSVIKGEALLEKNYPTMYAVGRASPRAPRMIDLRWKPKRAGRLKKVTLVGKGVCFDSGGLDLKPASAMLLMKKDMAGSAMTLALAKLIMAHNLPIDLRLMIGAVDNVVSGNSYKPGDVIKTRSGKTVEVINTDAEGRLVMCDLLTEGSREKPDLLINFATLTGAGRVALGEEIPAFFTNDKQLATQLMKASEKVNDPIWPLPLVQDYRSSLKSEIADILNCVESPYGGAITAGLFLETFVENNVSWVHFDTCAWHFKPKPGRPVGADAFAIRAVFAMLT